MLFEIVQQSLATLWRWLRSFLTMFGRLGVGSLLLLVGLGKVSGRARYEPSYFGQDIMFMFPGRIRRSPGACNRPDLPLYLRRLSCHSQRGAQPAGPVSGNQSRDGGQRLRLPNGRYLGGSRI